MAGPGPGRGAVGGGTGCGGWRGRGFGGHGNTLDLKVLLIGDGAPPRDGGLGVRADHEGVPYTEVDTAGTAGSETVTLPALSSGTTGNFNGVVIAGSPADFAAGQLTALDTYESDFGVRQIDGYMFPTPARARPT